MPQKRNIEVRDTAPPSADPCASPQIDVESWAEGALTEDCAIRLPPWLRERHTSLQGESIPYLLLRWHSPDAESQADEWVAAWLDAEPGFPGIQQPAEWKTKVAERARCLGHVDEHEIHISTWRIVYPAGHSLYAVAAYWELAKGKWVQLAAQARTLPNQLDLLAALRSVRSRSV
jgi:hypothetical protein